MSEKPQNSFCEKAERVGLHCRPCFDAICTTRGDEQVLYREVHIRNTINIYRTVATGRIMLESDIEIPYQTQYPFPRSTGKIDEFEDELHRKEVTLTMAIGPNLPEGAKILRYHRHYRENVMPDTVALHVHVGHQAKDLAEAKQVAAKLFDVIDPKRLTKLLE